MTITLAPTNPQDHITPADEVFKTIQITHPDDHLNTQEILDLLIKPALIAWGFNPTTVARIVFDDDNTADPY